MKETVITVGMKIINVLAKEEYRILYVGKGYLSLCKINATKLVIDFPTLETVERNIRNNFYELVLDKTRIIEETTLSEETLENYKSKKRFLDNIVANYGPTYMGLLGKKAKPIIGDYIKSSGYSKTHVWSIIRNYLQSGFNDTSLLDHRGTKSVSRYNYEKKPGRKPDDTKINKGKLLAEDDYKNFEKYKNKYMKSEVKSFQNAYDDMCDECYSSWVEIEGKYIQRLNEDRPTYNQFYFYVKDKTTLEERDAAKSTWRAVRNDKRVFTGTVMDGVLGPGHVVEMDAQEMDISIVSEEYPEICVGRPIIYAMIDVFSQAVLGYSIALDNNSVVGCTNCFFNLIEDKTKLYEEYCNSSFEFIEGCSMANVWPTGIRPAIIKVDRGSDFISEDVSRIAGELDIDIAPVSPGTGSMKPLIENFFGTIKKQLDDLLEKKGLIRKVYGSKHHKQACLDINDVRAIVLNHILYHNTHYLKNYLKSADMKRKKLLVTPANLWQYGVETLYNPKRLPNQNAFIFKLLKPDKATVSKKGIKYQGMRYFNGSDRKLNDLMYHQQMKEAPFAIRIDPRDMGHVYYLQDGDLQIASLDPFDIRYQDYYGMSLQHFLKLETEYKEIEAIGEEMNQQARIDLRKKNKNIISDKAKKSSHSVEFKNIRDNRLVEKAKVSAKLSVAKRFDLDVPEKKLVIESDKAIDTDDTTAVSDNKSVVSLNIAEMSEAEIQSLMEANSRAIFNDEDE